MPSILPALPPGLNELISGEDMSLEALRLLKVDAMMECEKAMDVEDLNHE